jgi:hypothetical protein
MCRQAAWAGGCKSVDESPHSKLPLKLQLPVRFIFGHLVIDGLQGALQDSAV